MGAVYNPPPMNQVTGFAHGAVLGDNSQNIYPNAVSAFTAILTPNVTDINYDPNSSGKPTANGWQFAANTIMLGGTNSLFVTNGVPTAAIGVNGDIAFNTAGAAGSFIYQKRAGAWVASGA